MNSLLLTALDYRTPRKANMQFIADELAKRGTTRFFSLRYSLLSKAKHDARTFLDGRANRVETVGGVDCYLWKVLVHPFNTRRRWLAGLESLWFKWYVRSAPAILKQWMREADVIFFESGSAILFIALAARLNPQAKRVYIASDDLATINVADFVARTFAREAVSMDALCLPSARLAGDMPASTNKYLVPHGLDASIAARADPSPYPPGRHVVSVGSMLFDRTFFEQAAPAFPDVTFHVIGSGSADRGGYAANVRVYDEMHHDETLRYIKHADVGVAPYHAEQVPPYLADTSMKLMQYAFFGLPAVCPSSVVGTDPARFGYQPGNRESVIAALVRALGVGRVEARHFLSWSDVADRLVDPARYPDTRLDAA
jgi:2-beta-glucuronyltransferase